MAVSFIIITGLSGAGKTVAIKALEDSGYYCVDNLPLPLLGAFAEFLLRQDDIKRAAVGIDIRERAFLKNIHEVLEDIKRKTTLEVVFLEAPEEVLLRRYKETRRPHPLQGPEKSLQKAIEEEKKILSPFRELADRVIDTGQFTPHQLRDLIIKTFGPEHMGQFTVYLISFGFKFGPPQDLDLMFDVRFLPNPHFVPELRPLTGLDEGVRNFVLRDKKAEETLKRLKDLLSFLLPNYQKEGKQTVSIGIGCTGGRHRSPVVVEELKRFIETELSLPCQVVHREI